MSAINEIYTSIADMTISSIDARNIDGVTLSVRQSDLPVRLLLPSTRGELEFVAIGNLQSIVWGIRDICLFAPLSAGSGIEQYAKSMADYIGLYMEEIKNNRTPTTLSEIIGVEVQMGPVPWGAEDYWAVDITLSIKEIL